MNSTIAIRNMLIRLSRLLFRACVPNWCEKPMQVWARTSIWCASQSDVSHSIWSLVMKITTKKIVRPSQIWIPIENLWFLIFQMPQVYIPYQTIVCTSFLNITYGFSCVISLYCRIVNKTASNTRKHIDLIIKSFISSTSWKFSSTKMVFTINNFYSLFQTNVK